jgi:hypothetical protein
MNPLHNLGAEAWTALHFGKTRIKDPRRQKRLQTVAEVYAREPGSTIPQLFPKIYDVKAAYTFFDREDLTPEAIQAGHKAVVRSELEQAGRYLLIEDGSEFNWDAQVMRSGLGKMREHRQGLVLYSSLAVEWQAPTLLQSQRSAVRVLGLLHQEYYPRIARPAGEANEASAARQKRPRESQLWQRSSQAIGQAPAGVQWIRVADRGADIELFLRDCVAHGHSFVVRAAQNRVIVNEESQRTKDKLFEAVRQAKALGEFTLDLRARPGQAARTVRLSVSVRTLRFHNTRKGNQEALPSTVIRVWEAQPSKGAKALEWILLTDAVLTSFEAALEVALQYASRWLIEEYHKCLKTGLGADDLQLETAPRLFNAIAIMAVVAVRLLALKELAHLNPDAPASTSGLSELELQILRASLKRDLTTVREVALALGCLGGHMNRPSDGLPGWQSLWKGMRKLLTFVEGVKLAQPFGSFGV